VKYKVEWGGSPQDVTVSTFGTGSIAEAMAIVRDLGVDDRCRSGLKILVDHSELESVDYTPSELRPMFDLIASIEGRTERVYYAIVAPKPVLYGLTRVWEAGAGDLMNATIQLFRSKEDALAWLGEIESGGEDLSGA
jgi:hypothetical protein